MKINKLPSIKPLDARSLDNPPTLPAPCVKTISPGSSISPENMTHIFFFFDVKRFYLAAQPDTSGQAAGVAPEFCFHQPNRHPAVAAHPQRQHFDEVFIQICRPAVAMGLKHHHQPAIRPARPERSTVAATSEGW